MPAAGKVICEAASYKFSGDFGPISSKQGRRCGAQVGRRASCACSSVCLRKHIAVRAQEYISWELDCSIVNHTLQPLARAVCNLHRAPQHVFMTEATPTCGV